MASGEWFAGSFVRAKTYGCVGAEPSLSTCHLGMEPPLAMAALQPGGILPNVALSKSMIFPVEPTNAKEIANRSGFICPHLRVTIHFVTLGGRPARPWGSRSRRSIRPP